MFITLPYHPRRRAFLLALGGLLTVCLALCKAWAESPPAYRAGPDLTLTQVQLSGNLLSGRDLDCHDCTIQGRLLAGRDVRLQRSRVHSPLLAGRDIHLHQSQSDKLVAGRNASLSHSQIYRDVQAGGNLSLMHSRIQGRITLSGPYMSLSHGLVDGPVRFEHRGALPHTSGGLPHGRIVASLSGRGLSLINGYTIQAAGGQTTVITPQQSVYINGKKASGEGPSSYAQYMSQIANAPLIRGPGWPAEPNGLPEPSAQNDLPRYRLEIDSHSAVHGDIEFIGGRGQVVLHPGGRIQGQVLNGTVQRL